MGDRPETLAEILADIEELTAELSMCLARREQRRRVAAGGRALELVASDRERTGVAADGV